MRASWTATETERFLFSFAKSSSSSSSPSSHDHHHHRSHGERKDATGIQWASPMQAWGTCPSPAISMLLSTTTTQSEASACDTHTHTRSEIRPNRDSAISKFGDSRESRNLEVGIRRLDVFSWRNLALEGPKKDPKTQFRPLAVFFRRIKLTSSPPTRSSSGVTVIPLD